MNSSLVEVNKNEKTDRLAKKRLPSNVRGEWKKTAAKHLLNIEEL